MFEIVRTCCKEKVAEWESTFAKSGKEMDMIHEVSKVFVKIILMCTFGEDLSENEIDYYIKG